MIHKPLKEITEDDLQSLVRNGKSEDRQLEYKSKLPGGDDAEVKEFLKDVSAMANTLGGDIVYGMEEGPDGDGNTVPLNVSGISGANADEVKLTMENQIRDCIKPRIIGIETKDIRLANANMAFVVRVPQSWTSPHVVDRKRHWRFYYRDSAGAHPMDVTELRHAMTLSDTLAKRLEEFRVDRIAKIAGDDRLARTAKAVLHLQPFASTQPKAQVDIRAAKRRLELLSLMGSGASPTTRTNFDGLLSYQEGKEAIGWLQIFRNGVIEAVDTDMLEPLHSGEKHIPASYFESALLAALARYLTLLRNLLVVPPVMLNLNLLGVRGYTIGFSDRDFDPRIHVGARQLRNRAEQLPIDQDDLLLRGVLIEDIEGDVNALLRDTFDTIWNAAGFDQSLFYDANGRRVQCIASR
jgi:Putative DNA-binding domain